MRVIAKPALVNFWTTHPAAKSPLRNWYEIARKANWHTPHDVKAVYPDASIRPDNVIIFNIGGRGKGYRLSGGMWYEGQCIFVRHVMTHDEYLKRTRDGTL